VSFEGYASLGCGKGGGQMLDFAYQIPQASNPWGSPHL
jgi:hypothetical protein